VRMRPVPGESSPPCLQIGAATRHVNRCRCPARINPTCGFLEIRFDIQILHRTMVISGCGLAYWQRAQSIADATAACSYHVSCIPAAPAPFVRWLRVGGRAVRSRLGAASAARYCSAPVNRKVAQPALARCAVRERSSVRTVDTSAHIALPVRLHTPRSDWAPCNWARTSAMLALWQQLCFAACDIGLRAASSQCLSMTA